MPALQTPPSLVLAAMATRWEESAKAAAEASRPSVGSPTLRPGDVVVPGNLSSHKN
jgi:hypothetical protein